MKYTVTILLIDGTSRTGVREFTSTAKITEYQDIEARGYFRGIAERTLGAVRIKQVEVHRVKEAPAPQANSRPGMPTGGHYESNRHRNSAKEQTNFTPWKPKQS
jgi:hypothetical protein